MALRGIYDLVGGSPDVIKVIVKDLVSGLHPLRVGGGTSMYLRPV